MKIKVCGLNPTRDVQTCIDLNVDFLGFVFYEKSPRNIDLKENHTIYLFNPSKKLFYMQSKMTEFQNSIQTGFLWEKLKLLCMPTQSSNIYGKKKRLKSQRKFDLNIFDWGDSWNISTTAKSSYNFVSAVRNLNFTVVSNK